MFKGVLQEKKAAWIELRGARGVKPCKGLADASTTLSKGSRGSQSRSFFSRIHGLVLGFSFRKKKKIVTSGIIWDAESVPQRFQNAVLNSFVSCLYFVLMRMIRRQTREVSRTRFLGVSVTKGRGKVLH